MEQIKEGTRRVAYCEKAECNVEQDFDGNSWLCLHDGEGDKKFNN